MRSFKTLTALVTVALSIAIIAPALATDLSRGQDTVNNIRQADPPRTSTTTKQDPSGTPSREYKHEEGSLKIKEPPSPARSYNPNNDPDVEAGYKRNQKRNGY